MKKPTYKEIANSLSLWIEYACGNEDYNNSNTDHFNSMTEQEKINYQTEYFGKEFGVEFGLVLHADEELELTQFPYQSDIIGEENFYTATASCVNGNLYKVLWPITNFDCEDESDSCDWENYEIKSI